MKVGIVHNAYLQKGGEDVMVQLEYQLLKKHNIAVEILYFKNSEKKVQQLVEFAAAVFNPVSIVQLNRWIDTVNPDVIHIHNWHYRATPAIIRRAKKKGIPVVHTLHNFRLLCPSGTLLHNNKLSFEYLNRSFPWKSVKHKAYHNSYFQTFWLAFTVWMHRVWGTWRLIDKYIVLTEHAKKIYLLSHLMRPDQIAIKPNFMADITGEKMVRSNHFLFAGRLSEEKGIAVLLKAFAGSPWQLRIVGDGPLKKLVEQYCEKYNNIAYLGFKDKNFIISELKTCTAFIFSSIWYEGNPLTIIESLACGTPVIASGMGAMQSMISDGYNGLHFTPGSDADLLGKLNNWQQLSPSQKAEFYQNARQTFEDTYTPEKNIEKLISIYKSVLYHAKTQPAEPVH